jgi:hypothetical protein
MPIENCARFAEPDVVFGEYRLGWRTPPEAPVASATEPALLSLLSAVRRVETYAMLQEIRVQYDLASSQHFAAYTYSSRVARLQPDLPPLVHLHMLLQLIAHAQMHHAHYQASLAAIEAEACATIVCDLLGFDASPKTLGCVASWTHDPQVRARAERRGRQKALEIYAGLFPVFASMSARSYSEHLDRASRCDGRRCR